MGKWIGLAIVGLLVVLGLGAVGSYNSLVSLDQQVRAQWGQVENVYQRRADLVPNLVETVKGAASFEQKTLTDVIEARAKATQTTVNVNATDLKDPQAFQQFQAAQQQLSGSLSRLLATAEAYPQLSATQNFRDLQAQLEGTENRISVERMRFNDASRAFNEKRMSFPTVIVANFFGSRFNEKPYFQAQQGAEQAPKVKF